MKMIPVGKNHFATVDDEDFSWLSIFKWFLGGQCKRSKNGVIGYATTCVKNKMGGRGILTKMDRMLMGKREGFVVDHINGDSLDNRRSNLQFLKHHQNILKGPARSHSSTGFRGVQPASRRPGYFTASVKINKRSYFIGNFPSKEEAAQAYRDFMAQYWANPESVKPPPNKRKNNVSGEIGVSHKGGKWVVRKMRNYKSFYVGSFNSLEEAREAVAKFEREHPKNKV